MAEPEENTYVITMVLRNVRKQTAIDLAGELNWLAYQHGIPSIETFTAHLKDEQQSF